MKAALYCRVSTEEQAKSGFSLRQQLEVLRRYCRDHDIEVVGEFQDTSSGANLDRPGLDAFRDRISLGGVDLVLCQDRDRISREPAHVYILREELLEYGTTLRSLNDRGDDSPEGALHDGILDQLAKFSMVENGVRTYKKKVKRKERPREEWTAIPVPDSGIPPETIYRARSMVENNTWNVSPNPARTWELSGGIGLCGQCGSRLKTYSTSNAYKTKYFYYLCSNRISSRENGTCPNTKHYPAETLELLVKDTLVDAFREEFWIDFVNDTCDQRLRDLRKMHRSNSLKARERLSKRIDALGRKETRLKDLYVDGDISKEEYGERKIVLEEGIAQIIDELSKLDDLDGELQRIEHLRVALLSVESPLSGHYCFTETIADLETT